MASRRSKLKQKLLSTGTKYECVECGISEWRGKLLSLHLDHINGINNDDREDNLRLLCPNCHSLTETYCGKNNKFSKTSKKVDDEVLLDSMINSKTVKESLENVGLAGAGNYQRVYDLASKFNIEHCMSPKIKNKLIIERIKSSEINFKEFGWVEKVSKIINISPQKTRAWISRNCPEILVNAYLRQSPTI
jgi:predicted RNA-binding Zn-ribbon protein involved in translation (DUF1610 family)